MTKLPREMEDLGKSLHQRMVRGDPTAFAAIAESHMEWISKNLTKRYSTLYDQHLISSAVVDALYNYQGKPERYNPEKGSLAKYLLISADGDLRNLLARDKKKTYIPIDDDVELSSENQEYRVESAILVSEDNVEELVIANTSQVWDIIKEYLPAPMDQEICKLLMENIRTVDEFAKVLGLQDLPIQEQRSIVKRHKDRIKKVLLRNVTPDQLSGLYE
jgi:RNA polymerase sigma-70 factor, ECF subfamily